MVENTSIRGQTCFMGGVVGVLMSNQYSWLEDSYFTGSLYGYDMNAYAYIGGFFGFTKNTSTDFCYSIANESSWINCEYYGQMSGMAYGALNAG